jgi:hypothetical protein
MFNVSMNLVPYRCVYDIISKVLKRVTLCSIVAQLVKQFFAFNWNRKFITVLRALHCTLFWGRWIQFKFFISPHLPLGLPGGLLPSGFNYVLVYVSHVPVRTTCPVHLILIDLIIIITCREGYKLWTCTLCKCSHSNLWWQTVFLMTRKYNWHACFFHDGCINGMGLR